jgi:hypothetical protein
MNYRRPTDDPARSAKHCPDVVPIGIRRQAPSTSSVGFFWPWEKHNWYWQTGANWGNKGLEVRVLAKGALAANVTLAGKILEWAGSFETGP